jgi:hypothetical protein
MTRRSLQEETRPTAPGGTKPAVWRTIAIAAAELQEEEQCLRARCRAAFSAARLRGEMPEIQPLGGGVLAMKYGRMWRIYVPDPADIGRSH